MESDNFIYIENNQDLYDINPDKVENICGRILSLLGFQSTELNVQFTSAEQIRHLNRDFREKDKETDVLSFPQMEWESPISLTTIHTDHNDFDGPPQTLGDIVVCPEKADDNAKHIGQSLDREICFLLVHGILHLCGHDHIEEEKEKVMLDLQNKIMKHLSMEPEEVPIWTECAKERDEK